MNDIFGQPLQRDPAIALPTVTVKPKITPGPVRNQQFVVELVGPRTAPADAVKSILNPQWQSVLGRPETFVMAGADSHWRPLNLADTSGAYDSIALAWDLITPQGNLSAQAAQNLWNAAEDLARQMGRRAMAMPVPADVDQTIQVLQQLKESLDIGVNFSIACSYQPFPEKEIWKAAAALGLEYSPSGTFEWKGQGTESPLFEVYSGDYDKFALAQVQSGLVHSSLGLGFSVPLCPDPLAALDGCLKAGTVLAQRLNGSFLDDDDKQVTEMSAKQMRSNLEQAIGALTRAGFQSGSTEAIKLFG